MSEGERDGLRPGRRSCYADAGPYEEFLRTVPVPVVGKPFDLNVLRETVRRVLSGP